MAKAEYRVAIERFAEFVRRLCADNGDGYLVSTERVDRLDEHWHAVCVAVNDASAVVLRRGHRAIGSPEQAIGMNDLPDWSQDDIALIRSLVRGSIYESRIGLDDLERTTLRPDDHYPKHRYPYLSKPENARVWHAVRMSELDRITKLIGADPQDLSGVESYKPAGWFGVKVAARLRHATSKKRVGKQVRSKTVSGVKLYCVEDARKWWPGDMPEGEGGA